MYIFHLGFAYVVIGLDTKNQDEKNKVSSDKGNIDLI